MVNHTKKRTLLLPFLMFFLVISPLVDYLTMAYGVRVSALVRAVQLILIILLFIKSSNNKQIAFLCIFIAIFFAQQLNATINYELSTVFLLEHSLIFFKLISFPLLALAIIKLSDSEKSLYTKYVFGVGLVYVLLVPISSFLGPEFKTYGDTSRFGFKGVIGAANETAILLIVMLYWSLNRFLKIKNMTNLIIFLITIISCMTLGTKSTLLSVIIAINYIFFTQSKSKTYKYITLSFIIIAFVTIVIRYQQELSNYLNVYLEFFKSKLESEDFSSYLRVLLSGRDYKLQIVVEQMMGDILYVALFGGWPVAKYYVEMDLVDISLFVGVPVSIIFLFAYYRCVFIYDSNKIVKTLVFNLTLIMVTAGHVLFSFIYIPFLVGFLLEVKNESGES
ncbi:membrane hypothetical protein [Vibrio chagasii]|nr:membrane hypothetical protein [Vibrio chagasii]CAH7054756.1 membrane hypothetical protein [Vibrio chagasii]CAH7063981.1 membrane hypothetical protein [Vibrio chagasii]CAH7361355.1 membrane hypothetical protein [Vibrio chagasii]CAH7378376.1 membrane hypothetical protein [Vibrio chagasii]